MTKITPERLRLYIVLETSMLKVPLGEFMAQITEAGATAVQLRDKYASGAETAARAVTIKKYLEGLKGEKPLFIINDRADVAECCGADGVHLGVKDLPPELVRKAFPGLIIGLSCNNGADAEKASLLGDYAGIGPVFPTSTKKDLRPVIGLSGAGRIAGLLSVPAVAIGGITAENAAEVMKTGVAGPAVSSYVCASPEPYEAVKALIKASHERI